MSGVGRWILRCLLFAAAVVAPLIGYSVRVSQTGNAETAIDGFGWGFIGTIAALLLIAISFRTTAIGMLGRLAVATVAVLVVWGGLLGIANL